MNPTSRLWLQRGFLLAALLALWEAYGAFGSARYTSRPSAILDRFWEWASGDLLHHVLVTTTEIASGLAIGVPLGLLVGMALGRSAHMAAVFRPFVVLLNSLPIVALTPLLIMWFGLGMQPKIVLVAFVSFLLMFFNAFSGARAVDEDLVDSLTLMGASARERFLKIVGPSCLTWAIAGLRNALPYALIAAVIGEMMLSRDGLGHLITQSAQQFDMTGIYTALFVLMIFGAAINEATTVLENRLLRWRHVETVGG
ncbi:NitT/TauT family transport system permease protein [Amorphus suaedae]